MHIVIDTQPDPALWRAAFRHVLRRPMRRVRAFGAFFVLCGVVIIVLSAATEDALWVVGLFLLVIGVLYALLLPGRAAQTSLRRMAPALQQPQRIELTDQSVRVMSPLMSTEYAWAAFVKMQEIPGILLLMLSRNQVLPVPIGGLPPEQLAQLREFVANREFVRR
jgi:uncharacterized protein YjeT (DUF2065 family)